MRCSASFLRFQHVHDGDVDLLAVAVAAANPLLHALRIPGQVEIHDQRAELKVDAFSADSVAMRIVLSGLLKASTTAAFMSAVFDPEIASVPSCFARQFL